MINFFKQIFQVYTEIVFFKRPPVNSPESIMMLCIAFFLANVMTLLHLMLNSWIGQMTVSMNLSLFMAMFQILLFLIYMRLVLWSQNLLSVWIKMCTCWLMMLFIFDLLGLTLAIFILGFSLLDVLTFIKPLLGWVGIIAGMVFAIWQVFFTMHLFKELLCKSIFFVLMIYIGWLGLNVLFIMLFKQWL